MTVAPRTLATSCAAVLVVGLTSACALNAGSAKAQRFEDDWRGTPDVAEVETDASNDLPFAGSAHGTLVVEPGTSAERVAELFHELGAYVDAHDGVDGSLEVEHLTLGARPDRERNDAVLDTWNALRDDPAVVGGELGTSEVSVDLDDPERFARLVADLALPGDELQPLEGTDVVVTAGPFVAEVASGDDPSAALDALRAVDDEYGVTEARLVTSPDPRLELRVVDPARIADAQALARSTAPEIAGALVVQGGDVTFEGTDADASPEALDLAVRLGARPDVTAVTVTQDGLEVRVDDVEVAVALADELADDPDAAVLGSVLAANDDVPGPGEPGPWVFRTVVAGRTPGPLTAADVRDVGAAVPALARLAAIDRVSAEFGEHAPLTEEDVAALARELAVRVPAGTPVQVTAGGDFAVELTAGPDPVPGEITYPTRIDDDVFYDAWREAWP
ncbi:hypothetical protein [Cellulosimicrobium cellulans]|uniref:hypothetical protein n=1 Tax=Cellulosimicrobium cellulans TaxID=1710 RepID=UPI0020977E56|nr:hypothetical protein [Cellulosimicrobium cellulans]MCO7275470.1 hypothetical protein [Cellulosimicrobium cellulans]